MTTAEQTKYRCESWTRGGGRWGGGACRKPAPTYVEQTFEWTAGTKKLTGYKPVCNFHASVVRRQATRYGSPDPVIERTAEAEKVIDKRLAEARKRQEEETAKKRTEAEERHAIALKRAAEAQTKVWNARREDDETYRWGSALSDPDSKIMVPRWYVQSEGDERGYDVMEVKVVEHDGQPAFEVRNSSRLTPLAAKGLIEALSAALKEVGQE
jgi:hypothetical protein